jgi:6-phosphogluconolactonase
VDERVTARGNPERNLTQLRASLLDHTPLEDHQIHAMPVESRDLQAAAVAYGEALRRLAGSPPVLDLVHLGLGTDGHTASLVPGDPVLDAGESDVAVTGVYRGWQRMTLTYPILYRARCILWVVTGPEKFEMLRRLRQGDTSIPAGRVSRKKAMIVADNAATGR